MPRRKQTEEVIEVHIEPIASAPVAPALRLPYGEPAPVAPPAPVAKEVHYPKKVAKKLSRRAHELLIHEVHDVLVSRETAGGGQKELWYRPGADPKVIGELNVVPVNWKVKLGGKIVYLGSSIDTAVSMFDKLK